MDLAVKYAEHPELLRKWRKAFRKVRQRARSLVRAMRVGASKRMSYRPRHNRKKRLAGQITSVKLKLVGLLPASILRSYKFILKHFLTRRIGFAANFKASAHVASFYYAMFPLFFKQQTKVLLRVTARFRLIIARRYQNYRIFSTRGFKRTLRCPNYPQFVKEPTTKSITYLGIPAKFRKKIAKFFRFPCRINLRAGAFFYFRRKLRQALKKEEETRLRGLRLFF